MVLNTAIEHYSTSSAGGDMSSSLTDRLHIITSNLEHDSVKLVLEKFKQLGKAGMCLNSALFV